MNDESVGLGRILALAVPAMGAGVLQHLFRPIDQFFVQGLGRDAQGALGAATFVVIFIFGPIYVISAGVSSHVARSTGAEDQVWRRRIVAESITSGALLALVLGICGYLLSPQIPSWLGLDGRMGEWCALYLQTLAVTGGAIVLSPTIDAACNAMGNTRLPLMLQAIAVCLNVVFTPTLIAYGWGVQGAALGSTMAQTCTTSLGLIWVIRRLGLSWSDFVPSATVLSVMNTGLPVGLGISFYAAVYQALMRYAIQPLGKDVYGALGVGFSALESLTWPVFVGFSIAMSALVGQSLGAGRPDLARTAIRRTLGPASTMGLLAMLIFWFAGDVLVGFFTEDPGVHKQAVLYASVLAFSQVFVALEAMFEGVLSGAGATRVLFVCTVPLNLMRVPLAYVLAGPYGAAGVWWAINITSVGKCLAKGAVVFYGRWDRVVLGAHDPSDPSVEATTTAT